MQPTLSCWQSANFNTANCSWVVSGTQAPEPTNLLCWQTAAFSTLTCSWVVTGTQAPEPTNLSCWQTAVFNSTSCSWDISGELQENIVNIDTLDSYTWIVNGQTYTISGTYYFVDSINCVNEILILSLTNDIAEELTNNLAIYPNPVSDILYVYLNGYDKQDYIIIDNFGAIVKKGFLGNISQDISVSELNTGIYYLKFGLLNPLKFYKL